MMSIKDYYENTQNLCLITKHLENRETSFLNADGRIIRGIKSNKAQYLKQNMDYYKLLENKYNIYKSVAKYRDFPLFSWNRDIRFKQYNAWTNKEIYKKHIIGYDYYIDFDNKDDSDEFVRQEVSDVSKYFKDRGFRHIIISSGKGYHIQAQLKQQTPDYARIITNKLCEKLGLTTPDFSIYKWQALIKVPYSIDFKTGHICTPIKPDMFEDFNKKDTKIT